MWDEESTNHTLCLMSLGLEQCCFFVCVRVTFVSRCVAETRRVKRRASSSAKDAACEMKGKLGNEWRNKAAAFKP